MEYMYWLYCEWKKKEKTLSFLLHLFNFHRRCCFLSNWQRRSEHKYTINVTELHACIHTNQWFATKLFPGTFSPPNFLVFAYVFIFPLIFFRFRSLSRSRSSFPFYIRCDFLMCTNGFSMLVKHFHSRWGSNEQNTNRHSRQALDGGVCIFFFFLFQQRRVFFGSFASISNTQSIYGKNNSAILILISIFLNAIHSLTFLSSFHFKFHHSIVTSLFSNFKE